MFLESMMSVTGIINCWNTKQDFMRGCKMHWVAIETDVKCKFSSKWRPGFCFTSLVRKYFDSCFGPVQLGSKRLETAFDMCLAMFHTCIFLKNSSKWNILVRAWLWNGTSDDKRICLMEVWGKLISWMLIFGLCMPVLFAFLVYTACGKAFRICFDSCWHFGSVVTEEMKRGNITYNWTQNLEIRVVIRSIGNRKYGAE